MKNNSIFSFKSILIVSFFVFSFQCLKAQSDIQIKNDVITIKAKNNITLWKGSHKKFSVELQNQSVKNSCELYIIRKNNNKKWLNPSLLAGKSYAIELSADHSLFIENYSTENIIVRVKITE